MKKSMFWILSVALIAGMSSCKPSQSAYKAAYEKAQEKPTVAEEIADPEFRPVAPAPATPAAPAQTPQIRESSERINAVDGNDALLKEYNVIVGSFIQKVNAMGLRDRLIADGYTAILAQNAEGMFRVVACSFDNRPDAVTAREQIKKKYPEKLIKETWLLINR